MITAKSNSQIGWLWVPAYAGTTERQSINRVSYLPEESHGGTSCRLRHGDCARAALRSRLPHRFRGSSRLRAQGAAASHRAGGGAASGPGDPCRRGARRAGGGAVVGNRRRRRGCLSARAYLFHGRCAGAAGPGCRSGRWRGGWRASGGGGGSRVFGWHGGVVGMLWGGGEVGGGVGTAERERCQRRRSKRRPFL